MLSSNVQLISFHNADERIVVTFEGVGGSSARVLLFVGNDFASAGPNARELAVDLESALPEAAQIHLVAGAIVRSIFCFFFFFCFKSELTFGAKQNRIQVRFECVLLMPSAIPECLLAPVCRLPLANAL